MKKLILISILLIGIKSFGQDTTHYTTNFILTGNLEIYLETIDYSDSTITSFIKLANPATFGTDVIGLNLTPIMIKTPKICGATKQDIINYNLRRGIKDPHDYLSQYY
jgi:hypothetical protein